MNCMNVLLSITGRGMTALALLCALSSLTSAQTKEKEPAPSNSTASIISYQPPGGETHFAISLQAASLPEDKTPRDHAILFDTSASQGGAHRRQALAVLESCLESLGPDDRVCLFAIDVAITALSEGYHPPRSEAIKTALSALRKRVPLGATDLQVGLQAALKSFEPGRKSDIIYIGDGMSTGRLIPIPVVRTLLADLRKGQTPVHSFAVGPRTDLHMLGVLAAHTGGVVLVDALIDDAKQSAAATGKRLAVAAGGPVLYLSKLVIEPEIEQLLPRDLPPLRKDRTTVLLGHGTLAASFKIHAVGNDGRTMLDWTVASGAPQSAHTFLMGLWSFTEKEHGTTLSLAGAELLNLARQEHQERLLHMAAMGHRAIALGNFEAAEKIAWSLREADPENVESRTILNAVQKGKRPTKPAVSPPAPGSSKKPTVK